MQKTVLLLALIASNFSGTAQSKVFKEIAGSVKSDFNEIRESGSVIGYLSLIQIEKTDIDSFNYEIKIMDENLNDMGEVKFKEIDLDMQSVAYENNVLCLSFIKHKKEKIKRKERINSSYAQYFINLQGEVINKNDIPISQGSAEHSLNVNIPTKGFVLFLRDYKGNKFVGYDDKGNLKWEHSIQKKVPGSIQATSNVFGYHNIEDNIFEFYDVDDPKKSVKIAPKAPKEMKYALLSLQNIDNKLVYSGTLRKDQAYLKMKQVKRGLDKGVFVLEVSGLEKSQIKERVSYWGDGSSDLFRPNATLLEDKKNQAIFGSAVSDKNGNVYFYSSNLHRKVRVGNIVASTLTAPFIFFPIFLSATGYTKFNYDDGSIFMLDAKNKLKVYDQIETEKSAKLIGPSPFGYVRPYVMKVGNSESNETHFVIRDAEEYKIYNVSNKKVKSFPTNKKGITTNIYSAKDGHILVLENNKDLKETKLSIVAL